MANVRLIDICKVYPGGVRAVSDFNIDIDDKEFIVFVGPSGCGKSTTLRMIAGLENITSGKLYIDDKLMNDLEPKDRDIAMVFQNYALYPHMSVYDNIAYCLKCHNEKKEVIDKKVNEVAKILDITEYLQRKPKELSGGQRQRVALGRAIVREPKVFLLDEPLSNLDAKLRVQMRSEITKLHQKLGTTFIYVTHDQTEAMTMGTRIVVMKDGIVQQIDTPTNLYCHPVNTFVATFLGSPQMNLFDGRLEKENDIVYFVAEDEKGLFKLPLDNKIVKRLGDITYPKNVYLGVRPNELHVSNQSDYDLESTCELVEKLGNETLVYCYLPGNKNYSISAVSFKDNIQNNDKVFFKIDMEYIHFFDKETTQSLFRLKDQNFVTYPKDKTIVAHFKNKMIDSSILDDESIKTVKLGIPSNKISLLLKENSLAFTVLVDSVVTYSSSKMVYSHIEGKNEVITFEVPLDKEINEKDTVTIYAELKDVRLFNDDCSKRLSCKFDITQELIKGQVKRTMKDPLIVSTVKLKKDYGKLYTIENIDSFNDQQVVVCKAKKDGTQFMFLTNVDNSTYINQIIFIK